MAKFVVNGTTYEHDPSKFTFAEGRAVEKVTGHTFAEIEADPKVQGSIDVMQALLWVSMKRGEPTLRFDDLDDLDMKAVLTSFTDEDDEPGPTDPAAPGDTDDPPQGETPQEPSGDDEEGPSEFSD